MNDYRPISVLALILVIALTGVVFFYPANSPEKDKPTVEIISEK
jgi:ABC-type phosphate transport system auxiliary subunit